MRFIVTGGAGFIGSHLVEGLLDQGHQVVVIDNLATGCLDNLPNHPRLQILVKNLLDCSPEDFAAIGPVAGLAHLAATPSVQSSWQDPVVAHHQNLSTTVAAIHLCQQMGIPRLVLASSAAVYGNQTQLPIPETSDTHPIAPYGLQKLVSEQYASLFAKEMGFSAVALRIFNAYGPRQSPDSPYSGVISIFSERMRRGLPITIYGDGFQTRDFIYVKDVVQAFASALTVPLIQDNFVACNLGSQRRTSLLDLVEVLSSCIPQWQGDLNFAQARTGDIRDSEADISRATEILTFSPQWTIQMGLRQLVKATP